MSSRKKKNLTAVEKELLTKLGQELQSEERPETTPLYKRVAVRLVIVFAVIALSRYFLGESSLTTIASVNESTARTYYGVQCSADYKKEKKLFKDCLPSKCGRVVMDHLVSPAEAKSMLRLAKSGLAHGGSNGGASILDLHSGALSKGDKFVNIYRILEDSKEKVFTEEDFELYRKVKNKIHKAIAREFGIPPEKLYLTKPTFFSRISTKPAKTIHDEYWHPHVDKETYGSFHYTSLLYLTSYQQDFTGGRFVFIDKDNNRTVEPRLGRVSFFTSGSENLHHVEKVRHGTRYAITVSFTCDKTKAIDDPQSR